jgi:hypothetical protein
MMKMIPTRFFFSFAALLFSWKQKKKIQIKFKQMLRATPQESHLLQAYTRAPAALFSSVSSTSSLRHASRGPQPVLYRDAVFAIDVGKSATAGSRMHAVTVDWHRGVITAFLSASDFLNGVAHFSCGGLLPPCKPLTAEEYVRETFEFLQRGHSLHHPACRCYPRRRAHERGFMLWGDDEASDNHVTSATNDTTTITTTSLQEEDEEEDPYIAAAATPGYIGYCTVVRKLLKRTKRSALCC